MTHHLVLIDLAGRVSKDIAGGSRVTSAAVVIDPAEATLIRGRLVSLPKWSNCSLSDLNAAVHLLMQHGRGMAALSWDRDTAEWFTFWEEATWVCDLITKQDRKRVSFARPATIARYMLFGSAMAVASSHAVAKGFRDGILDARGLEVIEQTLVIDTDFSGKETVEFLNQIWGVERAQPLTNSIGFRLTTRDLLMKTEQEEPLLLLADYLAGLVHCALVQDPGRIRFPVDRSHAAELLRRLSAGGRLLVKDEKFNISCKALFPIVYEVFGEPPR